MMPVRLAAFIIFSACVFGSASCGRAQMLVEHDVAVPMRDGVLLRADIYRPKAEGKHPVLVYRTPYDKQYAADAYQTHLRAVERGYVVVLQDVRGRHASDGIFNPYFNEGKDGFDTIEWAAKEAWSNGQVGTFGLSYPGAVQWLAAVQSPPHLKAMVPAMTFSNPGNFFYMNGVFDMSWLSWTYFNIAPGAGIRNNLPGPTSDAEVAAAWQRDAEAMLSFVPLSELPFLREEAPFYFEWLEHEPTDPWWAWADIRGHYDATDAAVLNISGWYDEAYGPEGATTNHNGLVAARPQGKSRSELILGPWQHGVVESAARELGELDFGSTAGIDYDAELLNFFDRHLKVGTLDSSSAEAVRYFVMGANEWRRATSWPPPEVELDTLCLQTQSGRGLLGDCAAATEQVRSTFRADPADPVVDPYSTFEPHDYQELASREDLLIFETEPLTEAITVVGDVVANMFVSCDCKDFDLWVRLLDVYPDGRVINLMSPGGDVQRVSYRDGKKRQLIRPGETIAVSVGGMPTANQFDAGHRIRVQVSASFAPHLSRNLQTGALETDSSISKPATITILHGAEHQSSLALPVMR